MYPRNAVITDRPEPARVLSCLPLESALWTLAMEDADWMLHAVTTSDPTTAFPPEYWNAQQGGDVRDKIDPCHAENSQGILDKALGLMLPGVTFPAKREWSRALHPDQVLVTRPDRSDRKELALQLSNGVVTPTVRISRPPRLSIEYIKKAQHKTARRRSGAEARHPDADDKMATRTLNINGARWHQVKEQASCMSWWTPGGYHEQTAFGIMSGSDQFHPWQFQAWNELDSNLGESERAVARKERALIWVPRKAVPSVLYHYHEEGVHGSRRP